jgi:O-antigen ligase
MLRRTQNSLPSLSESDVASVQRSLGSRLNFSMATQWSLAICIAVLPLMQLTLFDRFDSTAVVADAVFLVACCFFVVALLRGELTWRPGGFYLVLGIYAGALLLSTLAAADRRAGAGKLVVETYLLAIAILTFNVVRSERTLKLLTQARLIGTVLTVVTGIAGIVLFYCNVRGAANIFLSHYGTLLPGNYPRIRGLFLNMNMCCNYLSVSFLLLLAMRSVGWIGQRAAFTLGSAIVVAAVFTFSPGLGGLALGAGLWFWADYRERGRGVAARTALLAGIVAALAFIVAMLVSPPSLFGPDGRFELSHLEPSGRVLCWQSALYTAWHHPWLGDGPGSMPASVDYLTASGEQQHLSDAHNTFLSIAAKDGIFGLAAFAALLIFLLRKTPLQTRGRPRTVLRTAVWIGLLQALLYQGLGGSWEHTRHIWVLIGLMAALQADRTYAPDTSSMHERR